MHRRSIVSVGSLRLCPTKDFILLILLCSWLSFAYPVDPPFEVLDLFAGRGRISELACKLGCSAAAYDLKLDQEPRRRFRRKAGREFRSPMDWNGEAGFASFGSGSVFPIYKPFLLL